MYGVTTGFGEFSNVRISRDEVMRELIEAGVSCRRGIPPIHLEPLYAGRGPVSLPVTEAVAADSIFIPMYASLPEPDQAKAIDAVVRIVTR